jgi:predicted nucleic acid-binding protein
LLDTSVISALAPGREKHLPAELAIWLQTHEAQFFIPSIAVAELAQGIAKLRRSGGIERAARLEQWLDSLTSGFADRILPVDSSVARLAGQLSDAAVAIGRHPGFADVAIAAIAQRGGLVVLTRNLKHFQPLGVACADPFEAIPK